MLGEIIGSGTFGKVFISEENKDYVYKVIDDKFKMYSKNEINILKKIEQNNNCCNLIECFEKDYKMYLKFPKYKCTLNQYPNNFNYNQILKISYQILEALEYFEFIGVIHCDLKPENIMFEDQNYDRVRIIDFGSSIMTNYKKKIYNDYIQTRWYCSPDVILGKSLSIEIDLWSLGCIVYELQTKNILFSGKKSVNENRKSQLLKIIEVLGIPDEEYLKQCKLKHKYFSDKITLIPLKDKYSLINLFSVEDKSIIPGNRKLENEISDQNILLIIKLIFRYSNRPSIIEIKNKVVDLMSNKKIKY